MRAPLFALTSALLALLVTATLHSPSSTAGPKSGNHPGKTPAGWERIHVGPFTIAFPPGWEYKPEIGRDSMIGSFIGPDMALGFQFGEYNAPGPEPGEPGYIGHYTRISCKVAKLVTAIEEPAIATGVFFPSVDVYEFVEGDRTIRLVTKLGIWGTGFDPTQRALALRIFETVHFPGECLQTEKGEWEILPAPEGVLPMDVALDDRDSGWLVGLDSETREGDTGDPRCASARLHDGVWTRVPCPANDILWGLSLEGPDSGWAAGGDSILRLQGGTWSIVSDTVGFPLFDVLTEPSGSGWAVGLGGGLLKLVDGNWTAAHTDPPVHGTKIERTDKNEIHAGGGHRLFHLEDDSWRELPSPVRDLPADSSLQAFVPEGGEQGWFAGAINRTRTGIVWRRDARGRADWTTFPDVGPLWDIEVITADRGASAPKAWVVGGSHSTQPAVLLELDDETWHTHRTVFFNGALMAVDMHSADSGWAVGHHVWSVEDGVASMSGVLMHYRAYADRPPLVTPPPPTATPSVRPHPTTAPSEVFLPVAFDRP